MSVTSLASRIIQTPIALIHRLPLVGQVTSQVTSTVEQGVQTLGSVVSRGRDKAAATTEQVASAAPSAPAPASTPNPLAAVEDDDAPIEVDAGEVERVTEHLLEEEQLERHAGELADPESDLQEVQAALRAKHLLAEQVEDKRAQERHHAVEEA